MRRSALLLILALASLGFAQHPFPFETEKYRVPSLKTKGSVLIKNVRVMTAAKGSIPSADVLVLDGKIKGIGSKLTAPTGTPVIEAKGLVLTPGLIDGHSHRGSDGTNEGAETVTCEVRIGDVLNLGALNVWQALASGHTSALVLHGSANAIGGESIVIKYKYRQSGAQAVVPDAPRQVKFALGENVTRKGDEDGSRFPRSRMGVEASIRRAFSDAQIYRQAWRDYEAKKSPKKPRYDLRLQTLADILDRKVWVQCHSYRSDEMLMLVRLSQEFGFKIGAMQHALEAYKIAPELAKAGVGVSIFLDNWSFKVEGYDAIPWNAALCTKAGVSVSVNTDGLGGTSSLILDAAKTMRFGGLSEEEALKTVTLNAANQLGIGHRTGSIEVGKDADLVLWSGHPFSVYSKCMMTMVEGEVLFQRRDAFGVDSSSPSSPVLPRKASTREAKPLKLADRYAIVGADVYPSKGSVIKGATVIVEKGRITGVGKDLAIPRGAVVVQAKGQRVYPGFFDGYSTLGLGEISPVATMMDNTELGTSQPDLDALTALWVESAHYGPALYAGVTNAFTGPSFGVISGQGAVIHMDGRTPEEFGLKRRAALLMNPGGGRQPVEFDVCHDAVSTRWLLGLGEPDEHSGHAHHHHAGDDGDEDLSVDERIEYFDMLGGSILVQQDEADRSSEADQIVERTYEYLARRLKPGDQGYDPRQEAMRPYLIEKRLIILAASTPATIRRAVAFAKRHKLNVALRGAAGAWKEAKLLAEAKIPVILSPAGRTTLFANAPENPWEPYDTPFAAPGILAKAGVKFCFGVGSPADVMNLAIRVGQHCAYGLSREDAIKALTLWPAEIFGVDQDLGSIEAGRMGNFIITDGDPFELTTTIRQVFIEGRPRPMVSKHTMLRDKYAARLGLKF